MLLSDHLTSDDLIPLTACVLISYHLLLMMTHVSLLSVQCLAPWLDGLTDPAQLKSDIVALGGTLSNDLAPALSAVAGDVNDLSVGFASRTSI